MNKGFGAAAALLVVSLAVLFLPSAAPAEQKAGEPRLVAQGLLDTLKEGFLPKRERRPSTAAGTRSGEEQETAIGPVTPDPEAVTRMENRHYSAEQVRQFISQGELEPKVRP